MTAIEAAPILVVDDLQIRFGAGGSETHAVRGISFELQRGECLGMVGESGSGKSVTFMAAMGLLPRTAAVAGSIRFAGQELLGASRSALNRLRGSQISMIFQDPFTALTPHVRVGAQLAEPLRRHLGLSTRQADATVRDWFERVRMPEPSRQFMQYPHELSGGMRQRAMIAGAMAVNPQLLIADEPTTALDVTVQAEILELMAELTRDTGTALALITHDMGIVARLADRLCVLCEGEVVEAGPTGRIFEGAKEDYTRKLIASVPRIDRSDRRGRPERVPVPADAPPVLEVADLRVWYPVPTGPFRPRKVLRAVDGVSLTLRKGETVALVGESGCGKTTLSRAILRMTPHRTIRATGRVTLQGRQLDERQAAELRRARKDLQIVFQDPFASLDPRYRIAEAVAEPLLVHRPKLGRRKRRDAAAEMLERVGLSGLFLDRYPHQLSGGQNQRVGIARAMILQPAVVICDEAVSALDVSVRADILDLLIRLQSGLGLAMLFITHDLGVVRELAHRVIVMFAGQVVEEGENEQIFTDPLHAYTRALLSAVPIPDPVAERRRQKEWRALAELRGDGAILLPPLRPVDAGAPVEVHRMREAAPGHRVAELRS